MPNNQTQVSALAVEMIQDLLSISTEVSTTEVDQYYLKGYTDGLRTAVDVINSKLDQYQS